mmetsp:Transcript_50591/g.84596  ORF Transcript_50591/g.84596 Transcript_50591/m.84596 type:complete len:217 (+) Transcript_50591:233-883(+)
MLQMQHCADHGVCGGRGGGVRGEGPGDKAPAGLPCPHTSDAAHGSPPHSGASQPPSQAAPSRDRTDGVLPHLSSGLLCLETGQMFPRLFSLCADGALRDATATSLTRVAVAPDGTLWPRRPLPSKWPSERCVLLRGPPSAPRAPSGPRFVCRTKAQAVGAYPVTQTSATPFPISLRAQEADRREATPLGSVEMRLWPWLWRSVWIHRSTPRIVSAW